jgi:hypothetical protein
MKKTVIILPGLDKPSRTYLEYFRQLISGFAAYGFSILLVLVLLFGSCDMFNNSAMDYLAEHTSEVRVADVSVKTNYAVMTNGTILIPPGNSTIGVALINSQNFTVIQNVSNSTFAAGTVTSQQTGPGEIEIYITGAALVDNYNLTLAMKSPDGLRDFPSRNISLKCVSFETALLDFTIDGATPAAFAPNLSAFTVNVPYSTTSVILGGTTLHSGATLAIYAGTSAAGTSLETPANMVTTSPQTLAQGNNYFFLRVTAPSSSTQDYAVTIYRGENDAKALTGFYFTVNSKKYGVGTGVESGSGSINEGAKTVSVTVPWGTSLSSLTPTVTHTGSAYSPPGLQNFSSAQTYTITAVDNSTQAYTVTVTASMPETAAEIQNAINAIPAGGTGTITLPNGTDVSLTGAITINGNRNVTITAASGTATLERDSSHTTGPLIDVASGSSLTLKSSVGSLVLDGGWDNVAGTGISSDSAAITVRGGGELTLENGATVKRNQNSNAGTGGGVYVEPYGDFTMTGGSIEYNEGGDGGGVMVKGEFTMTGGSITYNKAKPGNGYPDGGGVLVDGGGVFNMSGGEIAHNSAERYGGGVHLYGTGAYTATFIMSGSASIHNNQALRGGGIDMWQQGTGAVTFTMNSGTITANHATGNGGGVYNNGGTVNGSASPGYSGISGNTADVNYPDKNF